MQEREVFLKGNLTNQWARRLGSLLRDEKQAKCFAEVFMCQLLGREIGIERILIKLPAAKKCRTAMNRPAAVLDLWVLLDGQKRNMEVEIYEKQSEDLSQNIFSIRYYCVEAPAILIDSGVTKIRVMAGPEMEDYIRKTRKLCKA